MIKAQLSNLKTNIFLFYQKELITMNNLERRGTITVILTLFILLATSIQVFYPGEKSIYNSPIEDNPILSTPILISFYYGAGTFLLVICYLCELFDPIVRNYTHYTQEEPTKFNYIRAAVFINRFLIINLFLTFLSIGVFIVTFLLSNPLSLTVVSFIMAGINVYVTLLLSAAYWSITSFSHKVNIINIKNRIINIDTSERKEILIFTLTLFILLFASNQVYFWSGIANYGDHYLQLYLKLILCFYGVGILCSTFCYVCSLFEPLFRNDISNKIQSAINFYYIFNIIMLSLTMGLLTINSIASSYQLLSLILLIMILNVSSEVMATLFNIFLLFANLTKKNT